MKTFRLIGMALLAVVMCVNFASCSSDDDEEPIKNDDGVITNQKRLTRMEMVEDGSEVFIWEFTYDSKGRLSSLNQTETYAGETDWCITNYSWGNNVIMSERNYGNNYGNSGNNYGNDTYFLQDNLIKSTQNRRKYDDYESSLSYNSSKQLTNIQSKYSGNGYYTSTETYTYTWENGKIIRRTYEENNSKETYEYTYSGKTCKGYFPLYIDIDDGLFCAHPELIGLRCSQLPDQIYNKDEYYEEIEKYTYTFDKDGYVESCTVVDTDKNLSINTTDTDTTIYTFTWE